jgi:uncharacterized membrane protein YdbT with pleckstrin-like domain
MGYIDRNLLLGERVVYRTKLHWVEYVAKMFWSTLAGLVVSAIFITVYHSKGLPHEVRLPNEVPLRDEVFALPVVVFALAGFIAAKIKIVTSEFAVTNNRVLVKVGFIRRHSIEIVLPQVEGIGVDQSVTGRILGFGTITVSGTGTTREDFIRIRRPLEFRRQVQDNTSKFLAWSRALPSKEKDYGFRPQDDQKNLHPDQEGYGRD